MLHVVDDPAHGAENAGECRAGKTNRYEKQKYAIAKTEKSLHGEGVFSNLELAARRWADRLEGKKGRGPPQRAAATTSRNTDQVSGGMIWEEEREARRPGTMRSLQTLKMFEYSPEAAWRRRLASEQKYWRLRPRVDQYGSRKSSTNPSGLRCAYHRDSPLLLAPRASRDDDSRESGIDLRSSRHR
ncbi:MAG TPA: hypothetical protein VK514_11285 [Candidatus Acidoferrum sp.]|nr:hypothetical protein [Candidatus Acidoferrum sp.]